MRRASLLILAASFALPVGASATTIDVTLSCVMPSVASCDPEQIQDEGSIIFTIGVEESATQSGVDVNGYTLSYEFDPNLLSFNGAEQLASFGGSVPGFSGLGPCTPVDLMNGLFGGTCTAGNVPTQDAQGIGPLFSLGFEVTSLLGDLALEVGILDPRVDDITQGTGQPAYEDGDVVRGAIVPELATGLLVGFGLLALAAQRHADRSA